MAGRPTAFKEEYYDLLLKLSKEGKSWAAFCAEAGISRQTMYNWMEENRQFFDTAQESMQLRQNFWENHFMDKALGKSGSKNKSESAMQFILRTQFRDDYAEKKEVENTNTNIQINIDSDDAKL